MRPGCTVLVSLLVAASLGQEEAREDAPPRYDRDLAADEAETLVQTVVDLLDKRKDGQRFAAADALTELGHRAALPAMRYVVHDEEEDSGLRLYVMNLMLRIGVPAALGGVIPLLRSQDRQIRGNVHELLCWQHPPGTEFGYAAGKPPDENRQAIARWEQWWEANKETFEAKPKGITYMP